MVYFIVLLLTFTLIKAYKNTKLVNINTIRLTNDKKLREKIQILHLSDIHLENISISPEKLYRMLANYSFDIIALTGDYLDQKRSIRKLIPYLQSLEKLKPKYGMYAVFGNHDYCLKGENFDQLKKTLETYGCCTLQNEHITIQLSESKLNIIGIDDYSTNRSNISEAYRQVDCKDGYQLILTHDPNVVLELKDTPFDYLLSGHFHGGQIHWPKPYHLLKMGKLVRMKMIKGLNYLYGKPFYISEGLGQTGVNIRIGSRPEITIHEI